MVAQMGCDRALHQHVPVMVQSVTVVRVANVLVDTATLTHTRTHARTYERTNVHTSRSMRCVHLQLASRPPHTFRLGCVAVVMCLCPLRDAVVR